MSRRQEAARRAVLVSAPGRVPELLEVRLDELEARGALYRAARGPDVATARQSLVETALGLAQLLERAEVEVVDV